MEKLQHVVTAKHEFENWNVWIVLERIGVFGPSRLQCKDHQKIFYIEVSFIKLQVSTEIFIYQRETCSYRETSFMGILGQWNYWWKEKNQQFFFTTISQKFEVSRWNLIEQIERITKEKNKIWWSMFLKTNGTLFLVTAVS